MKQYPLLFLLLLVPASLAYAADVSIEVAPVGETACDGEVACYVPYHTLIETGEKVTWFNNDTMFHTVTAGDLTLSAIDIGPNYPNGFASSFLPPGGIYQAEFDEPGRYPYFCQFHPWLTGIITVEGMSETDRLKAEVKRLSDLTDAQAAMLQHLTSQLRMIEDRISDLIELLR